MRISSFSGRWLLTICCGLALAIAGVAGAVAIDGHPTRPGGRAPAPVVRGTPAPRSARYGHGPFISAGSANAAALALAAEMGRGARVLKMRLMSVTAADSATGQQGAAHDTAGPSREAWLVWLRGPWRLFSCIEPPSCRVMRNQVYWIMIDARTGVYDGTGLSGTFPGP